MEGKVIDEFSNWCPEKDEDLVAVCACKIKDDEAFLTHTFTDKEKLVKYNLHKLMLKEICMSYFDLTHADECNYNDFAVTDAPTNEKVVNEIDKLLEFIERL